MTSSIALIDGDPIVYAVGFAANADPLPYALHSCKKMLENIKIDTGASDYLVFLTSGYNNYREDIAKALPYKGNRSGKKPKHYNAIRQYLVDFHGAVVVDEIEADDALGICQCSTHADDDTVICTIDKDLQMIPGYNFNWKTRDMEYISTAEADRFFYTQMLTGDSCDNIPGLYKYCKERATAKRKERLKPYCYPETMYSQVEAIYSEAQAKALFKLEREELKEYFFDSYITLDQYLLEVGQLLWIQRKPGEIWTPPETPF